MLSCYTSWTDCISFANHFLFNQNWDWQMVRLSFATKHNRNWNCQLAEGKNVIKMCQIFLNFIEFGINLFLRKRNFHQILLATWEFTHIHVKCKQMFSNKMRDLFLYCFFSTFKVFFSVFLPRWKCVKLKIEDSFLVWLVAPKRFLFKLVSVDIWHFQKNLKKGKKKKISLNAKRKEGIHLAGTQERNTLR